MEQLGKLGNNKPEGKTIVICSAQWCGPCKQLKRQDSEGKSLLNKLEEALPDYKFYHADMDTEKKFAEWAGVRSIPAMVLLDGSNIVGKKFGIDNIQGYTQFITESFKSSENEKSPDPIVEQKSESHREVEKFDPKSKGFLHDMFGTGEEDYKPGN